MNLSARGLNHPGITSRARRGQRMSSTDRKNDPRTSQTASAHVATPRPNIIERLFSDKAWVENYRITADERIALSNAAMMGEVASERDVLFILNQIRRARLRW
jgi:hypothetical protein